uniref:3FTx-Ver-128 n=1 Tax=Vermicella annulata TaxID=1295044 RepID=R4G2M0_9SAUR
MKTLLLTLVVVTIVCLDLGYTLRCKKTYEDSVVCKEHETICYRYPTYIFKSKLIILKGCSASCPDKTSVLCCSTDMCNTTSG